VNDEPIDQYGILRWYSSLSENDQNNNSSNKNKKKKKKNKNKKKTTKSSNNKGESQEEEDEDQPKLLFSYHGSIIQGMRDGFGILTSWSLLLTSSLSFFMISLFLICVF